MSKKSIKLTGNIESAVMDLLESVRVSEHAPIHLKDMNEFELARYCLGKGITEVRREIG